MRQKRDLINVNADEELRAAIAELRRADTSGMGVPTQSDVIRKAVIEAAARLRQKAERRR